MILEWIATGCLAIGLIATWVRNGKNQAAKFAEMGTELEGLKDASGKLFKTCEKIQGTVGELKESFPVAEYRIKALEKEVFKEHA